MIPMDRAGAYGSGNLHPAIVNRSAASQGAGRVALNAVGGTPALDIDEAEARTRAREILQDFVKHKNRAEEVESQLQRALLENERLSHMLNEIKMEHSLERERAARELDNVKSQKLEFENRVELAQEEVRKVAQSFAQRASDGAAQLRLKEQEVQHLEGELQKAKEEIRTLRKDTLRLQSSSLSSEEAKRTHEKVVELARRCLDLEKAKEKLEQSILDDRKHYAQAIRSIEALRKQAVDAEERVKQVLHEKSELENRHEKTIQTLHKEMDMQRELYKTFMEQLASSGAAANAAASLSPLAPRIGFRNGGSGSSMHGSERPPETELAILQLKHQSLHEQNEMLQQQLSNAQAERSEQAKQLQTERLRHMEDIAALQVQLHTIQHQLDEQRKRTEEEKDATKRTAEQYGKLQAVHESLKADYSTQAGEVSRALAQLQELTLTHQQLRDQIEDLRVQVQVRESACDRLSSALASRRTLEEEIRQLKAYHAHELDLQRVQHLSALKISANNTGGNAANVAAAAYHAANQLFESSREGNESVYTKLAGLENEKAAWTKEREHLTTQARLDRETAQSELQSLQRALEQARVEAAERRAEAMYAVREVNEWRSAFSTSERSRAQVQQSLDEMRETLYGLQKEKSTLETKHNMFAQHIQRLESEVDRGREEIFRLRRAIGGLELSSARKELEYLQYRLNHQQAVVNEANAKGLLDSRSAERHQQELLQLRLAKEQLEDTVKDKEVAIQRLHQEHLVSVSQPPPSQQFHGGSPMPTPAFIDVAAKVPPRGLSEFPSPSMVRASQHREVEAMPDSGATGFSSTPGRAGAPGAGAAPTRILPAPVVSQSQTPGSQLRSGSTPTATPAVDRTPLQPPVPPSSPAAMAAFEILSPPTATSGLPPSMMSSSDHATLSSAEAILERSGRQDDSIPTGR